jgi:glycosyltransferase involved in cell wall biosynthesis
MGNPQTHIPKTDPRSDTICFFNTTMTWGGGEKWHFDMSQSLMHRGYKVRLYTNINSELYLRARSAGIPVSSIKVGGLSFLNPARVNGLTRLLRHDKAGTLIINDSRDLKLAGLAGRLAGVARIIYRRGSAIPIRNTLLNKWIFKHLVDNIIANSRQTARTILAYNSRLFPNEKIHVIYNGMDLPRFDSMPSDPPYRRQGSEVIIGHAGRLTRQKGQHHLLDMAVMLKQKEVDFKLLIAGKGPLEKELRESASDRGLTREVAFLGFTESVKGLMQASDIFVLPSLWEGFGYVLTEAMACGKPVVAFDISSNPEVVIHAETGFLVEPFNTIAMAEKIMQLARNPELRQKMGAAGRKRVEEHFTLSHAIQQIETLLSMKNNKL